MKISSFPKTDLPSHAIAAKNAQQEVTSGITGKTPAFSGRKTLPLPGPAGYSGVMFGSALQDQLAKISNKTFDVKNVMALDREVNYVDFLKEIQEKPALQRNTKQRIYDMIMARGVEYKTILGKQVPTYKFFTEPADPKDALMGMEDQIHTVVEHLQQSAYGTGAGKKLLLMVGGPGSGKSTLARALRKGLEQYSQSDEGIRYSLKWNIPKEVGKAIGFKDQEFLEEVYVDPIVLLPKAVRQDLQDTLNAKKDFPYKLQLTKAELPPASQKLFDSLLKYEIKNGGEEGSFERVLEKYAAAKRFKVSKVHRTGVGSLEARDSKSLEASHLVGNPKMIQAAVSSERDPWAYDFASGELFSAAGGIMEFIELLKLEKQHILPVLSLNEEGTVKPDKQPQVEVDEFVIAHTNLPEYEAKIADPEMAATMKRMKIVKFPYNTTVSSEQKIYDRNLPLIKDLGIHVAPHTTRTAAVWAVLTRLLPPSNAKFDLLTKLRLYDGEPKKDVGMADIRALKLEGLKGNEALDGISPREVEDNIVPAMMTHPDIQRTKSVDGYGVLKIIQGKLDSGELELGEDLKGRAYAQLENARKYLDEKVMEDVTQAIAGNRERLNGILLEYISNVEAYVDKNDIEDWRGLSKKPSEELMKPIEKKLGITDSHTYRLKLNGTLGSYKREGKDMDIDLFPDLKKAIVENELEQIKSTIPWKSLCTTEKLNDSRQETYRTGVIQNLIARGYDEESARHALARAGSLFNK